MSSPKSSSSRSRVRIAQTSTGSWNGGAPNTHGQGPLPLHVKKGEEESLAAVVEMQPPLGKVKTIGDSFMVSFADAVDAVLFGIIVQESLIDVPWPDAPQFGAINDKWDLQRNSSGDVVWCGIVIRVGIAYGVAKHEINPVTHRVDYRGRTVNLASRCESNAPHGAVNLSEECYDAVSDESCEHGRLRDAVFTQLAKVELKGIGFAQMTVITRKKLRGRVNYFRSFHKTENEQATLRDTLHELGLTKYARQLREAGLNTEADLARISSQDDLLPTGVPGFARNKLFNRAAEMRRVEIVCSADPDRKKRANIPSRASLSQDCGGQIVPDEHGQGPLPLPVEIL
eukprot:gene14281-biopygen23634